MIRVIIYLAKLWAWPSCNFFKAKSHDQFFGLAYRPHVINVGFDFPSLMKQLQFEKEVQRSNLGMTLQDDNPPLDG